MSWLITLVVGFFGAFIGAAGMFGIADACVKWYRISSFEGGSGYFVIGLTLLGAFFGFVLSVLAARVSHMYVSPHWYSQLGIALLAVIVSLAMVLAFAYRGVDRVPEIEGSTIDIVWEIRLPAEGKDSFTSPGDPRTWPDEELRLELVSVSNHVPRGSRLAKFDREAFRQENNQWILIAKVPLFTSKGEFCVNLTLVGRDDGFWPAMLPSPRPEYFQWSDWTRTNKGRDKSSDESSVMYRFRYEKVSTP